MADNAEYRLKKLAGAKTRRDAGIKALFIMGRCRMKVAADDPQPDALMEGLTSVATVAALAGFSARILDCRRHADANPALAAAAEADIVFFPVYLSQLGFFREFCRESRRRFPGKPLVAGGPLPTALPSETAGYLGLSAVVTGEGELPVLGLLEALLAEKKADFRGLPGVFVPGDAALPARVGVSDLSSPPLPDYSLWDGDALPPKPFSFGVSSVRGCAMSCAFCSRVMEGVRRKSPARFEEELIFNKNRFGASAVTLNDPHLGQGAHSKAVCRAFGRAGVKYFCFLRVPEVTPGMAAMLRETGCFGVYLGVESYNEELLRGINKRNGAVREMDAAVETLAFAGLRTVCGIIFGLPGETRETLENTLSFIKRHRFLPDIHYLTMDPGSPLYKKAVKSGAIKDPMAYLLAMEEDEVAHMDATAAVTGVPRELVTEYLSKAWEIKESRLAAGIKDLRGLC